MQSVSFYHSRPLEYSPLGEVHQITDPEDNYYEPAYEWLEHKLGFYSIFMAVGGSDIIPMTGYDDQFEPLPPDAPKPTNQVLFEYRDLPNACFSDYGMWHIVLNSLMYNADESPVLDTISNYVERLVLKPSWRRSDWLRAARTNRNSVQAHVPSLDFTQADAVWCKDQDTKQEMIDRGFDKRTVKIKRIKPIEHK